MHRNLARIGITAFSLMAALAMSGPDMTAAAQRMAVDTIILDQETTAEEVPVDIKWKTRKEGGKWVETLPVSADVDSLLLIINDEEGQPAPEKPQNPDGGAKVKKREMACNSRMLLYMKHAGDEWQEVFGTPCILSGGMYMDMGDVYGVYRADQGFGLLENPGSLTSYRQVGEKDYWIMDEESEDYGEIVTVGPKGVRTDRSAKLVGMKAYSNYGMILKPEDSGEQSPALIVNCQQADAVEDVVGGVQVPQQYVRRLLQLVDKNTRIVIAKDIDELEAIER